MKMQGECWSPFWFYFFGGRGCMVGKLTRYQVLECCLHYYLLIFKQSKPLPSCLAAILLGIEEISVAFSTHTHPSKGTLPLMTGGGIAGKAVGRLCWCKNIALNWLCLLSTLLISLSSVLPFYNMIPDWVGSQMWSIQEAPCSKLA